MIGSALKNAWTRVVTAAVILSVAAVSMPNPAAAVGLDDAIATGFGKLIKYGRWTAALVLAVLFCLAWAQRGQNSDNPHEVNKSTRSMIWTGIGFVAVIGYQLVLTGLVQWFNIDPGAIPSFLWQ